MLDMTFYTFPNGKDAPSAVDRHVVIISNGSSIVMHSRFIILRNVKLRSSLIIDINLGDGEN